MPFAKTTRAWLLYRLRYPNFLNSLQSYELIRLLANYSDNFFTLK